MSHTLSAKSLELMEMLPPYYWEEHVTMGVQTAFGEEIVRLDDMSAHLVEGIFPSTADDTYGMLSIWEAQVGLPIVPPDLTEDQRRERVVGRLRARKMNSGTAWEEAVTAAIGSDGWTYAENSPGGYQLTIYAPFGAGTEALNSVENQVRPFTPAHIEITVASIEGFVVDVSLVDEEPL